MILSYTAGGAIVTIEFDATIREDAASATTVTEYNVETGGNPSDHARVELDQITCDVIITNTPIRMPATNMDGVTGHFGPVDITTPTIPNFPRILPGVGLITSFLPQGQETTSVNVLNFDGPADRLRSVYNELHLLQQSVTLVTLTTRLRDYQQMIIRHLNAPRGPADGESMTFSFTAKAIRFVDSQVVSVKATDLTKKSKGVKTPKPTDPKDSQSVIQRTGKNTELGKQVRSRLGL